MMAASRCAAALLGVAAALALLSPAAAQETAASPSDTAYEAARKRFEDGKRLIREGNREGNPAKLEMAYVEFKEAHALYPRAKAALLNLVESEVATGRGVDAMRHLRQFVSEHGQPEEASEYGKAFLQYWGTAFKDTAHIDVDAPRGVHVLVDKDDVGIAPLGSPVDVSAGRHRVEGVGSQALRIEIDAPAGSIVKASLESSSALELSGSAVAVPPFPRATEASPTASLPAASGHDASGTPAFWTPIRKWGAVVGGAGLIGLGVGGIFAMQTTSNANRANTLSNQLGPTGCTSAMGPACSDLQLARSDQSTDFAFSAVSLAFGGAAVAMAAVLLLWPERSSPRAAVLPMPWTQGGGVQLRGEL